MDVDQREKQLNEQFFQSAVLKLLEDVRNRLDWLREDLNREQTIPTVKPLSCRFGLHTWTANTNEESFVLCQFCGTSKGRAEQSV